MSETPSKAPSDAKPEAEANPKAEAKPKVAAKPEVDAKPKAKPKPPKPEDKPFASFIAEEFIPRINQELAEHALEPERLELTTDERPVVGGSCPMVVGVLPEGRRFWLCFEQDNINSGKTIALADPGSDPTLLESFLIDEKRMSLALLVSRLMQRLNGQKWLGGN